MEHNIMHPLTLVQVEIYSNQGCEELMNESMKFTLLYLESEGMQKDFLLDSIHPQPYHLPLSSWRCSQYVYDSSWAVSVAC